MATPANQLPKYRASFMVLLSIVGFGAGLLLGYTLLGNPTTEEELRRATQVEMENLHGSATRKTGRKSTFGTSASLQQNELIELLETKQNHIRNDAKQLDTKHVANTKPNVSVSPSLAPSTETETEYVERLQKFYGDLATAAKADEGTPAYKLFPDKPTRDSKGRPPGDSIHVLFTSNGSPYQNFQARIMIGTYRLVKKMPGGEKLVALTRILHRTKPDDMMDEIPTFRANPLQPECDNWCWFPVADRANAVQQWIDAAEKDPNMVHAGWLLMLETDYVWVKPYPVPGDAWDPSIPGQSFAFDYIGSQNPVVRQLLEERCSNCSVSSVPNSGPAPVLMRFSDLKAATPIWEELSLWIEKHEEAKKMLGWVREMYAWDIAVGVNGLNIKNQGPPYTPLISQPPHDLTLGNASMYHYTWGIIYKEDNKDNKEDLWKFDKRFYTDYKDSLKVPKLALPPLWHDGIKLQDGLKVGYTLHKTVEEMLIVMNAGISILPEIKPKPAT